MTAQRNYAANDRQPAEGVFLALLDGTKPVTLPELIDRAHEAREAASEALHDPAWRPDLPEAAQLAYEARCSVADDAAYDARKALLDHLLLLGVTSARVKKLVEVLS